MGIVIYVGNELKGYGNLLLIKYVDGYVMVYVYNSCLFVCLGDKV